jgi:diphosphomevalonate decarboxylase
LKDALGNVEGWESRDIKAQDSGFLHPADVETLQGGNKGGVKRVILSQVGEGPMRTEESLIGADGEPVKK